MFKLSTKRLKAERNLRKIEKKLDQEPSNQRCFFYRSDKKDVYHHIVSKSEGLIWVDMEANLLPIGSVAHVILHSGYNKEINVLPHFKEYLEKMEQLDEKYYQRYLLKLTK